MKKFIRDKENHRSSIIQVTQTLIEQIGYEKISVRKISEQAKVSIGLIYKNFPSGKPEIVAEIFRHQVKEIVSPEDLSQLSPASLPQFIKRAIHNLILSHRKNQKINHALEAAYQENAELKIELQDLISQELSGIVQIFQVFNASKSVNIPNDPNWSFLLIHLLDSIIHRHVDFSLLATDDEHFRDNLADIILRIICYRYP